MSAEADAYVWLARTPSTPRRVLPELTIRGAFFALATGEYWTGIECSDFALFAKYLHREDIRPVLTQRAACGFNLLRVWTLFDIPTIGTLPHCDYRQIPAFVTLCAQHGLYVEFTAYTGINDPTHWGQLCDAAFLCQPRPLLELVNELDQNTNEADHLGRVFHLDDYDRCYDVVCAHGSNGSQACAVRPAWDYETFHTNDASEWQRKVGHNAMELADGTPEIAPSHAPVLTNENTRYPDKPFTTPECAYDAAAGAALLCAGSCFHSVHGKTSDLWPEGPELDGARAWAAGARSVALRFQAGRYNHPVALEDPHGANYLRVYQRILSDGSAGTVYIRRSEGQ